MPKPADLLKKPVEPVPRTACSPEDRLEEIYNHVLSLYPIGVVTRKLLTPLLNELGRRWESGRGGVAEEHFFAFYLRNKLGARYHHRTRSNGGPLLLIAGLPGEHHEFGLLLFSLAAHEAGYRIIPLGADMPLGELVAVARKKACSAIVLSGALEPSAQVLDHLWDGGKHISGGQFPPNRWHLCA